MGDQNFARTVRSFGFPDWDVGVTHNKNVIQEADILENCDIIIYKHLIVFQFIYFFMFNIIY